MLDLTGLFGLHCFGSSDQVSCNSFKSLSTWQISCVHSTFGVTGADAAAPRWLAAAFCGFAADLHGETVKNVTCFVDPTTTEYSNMLGVYVFSNSVSRV